MAKMYYIAIDLATKEVILTTSRVDISKLLHISIKTIERKLKANTVYICNNYIISNKVEPIYSSRGQRPDLKEYRSLLKERMRTIKDELDYQKQQQ